MTMTKSYAAQAGAPLILPSSLTLIVNLPSTRIDPKPCMCAALTYESDVIRSLQTYLYQASLDRRTRRQGLQYCIPQVVKKVVTFMTHLWGNDTFSVLVMFNVEMRFERVCFKKLGKLSDTKNHSFRYVKSTVRAQ